MTTLMLSRKLNESLWIGNSCQIILARFESKRQVRLAVKAPRYIAVGRNEPIKLTETLSLAEQIAASVIDCLRLNGIDDKQHTVAICDICNDVIDVIGGLRNVG